MGARAALVELTPGTLLDLVVEVTPDFAIWKLIDLEAHEGAVVCSIAELVASYLVLTEIFVEMYCTSAHSTLTKKFTELTASFGLLTTTTHPVSSLFG